MLNNVNLMGRLVRDPELRKTPAGVSVASFTVAVDRDYAANGAERETDFIDIVAWRSTADFIAKHFVKGDLIAVQGRLQVRNWTDKDGNKRRTAEVAADNAYFCGKKTGAAAAPAAPAAPAAAVSTANEEVPEDLLGDDSEPLPWEID